MKMIEESYVYFMQEFDNKSLIKIGISNNPRQRKGIIQCGNWRKLNILFTLSGTRADERALHDFFSEYRMPGTREWFEYKVIL